MTGRLDPITIITHPRYLDHDTGGEGHPETAARLTAILARLRRGKLAAAISEVPPREAEWSRVLACHDEAYLFRFEEAALSGRSYLGHPDNQICTDSFRIAMLAAGAGLAGVDLLEAGPANPVLCCVRPPGHHAERSLALGFCFFNNVAIAARHWQEAHGRRRIMILDWDAHHGNGIQAAFEEDPTVFYASIHEHPTFSFPGTGYANETGAGPGEGTTLNIPLPPGAGDESVLAALAGQVEPALASFRPEALIVAAGFDGHREDDMSGLGYTTALYGRLGEIMRSWARQYCDGRLLSILEGGYEPGPLAESVEAYCLGMAGKGYS